MEITQHHAEAEVTLRSFDSPQRFRQEPYEPKFTIGEIGFLNFGGPEMIPAQVIAIKFLPNKETYDLEVTVFKSDEGWHPVRIYNVQSDVLWKGSVKANSYTQKVTALLEEDTLQSLLNTAIEVLHNDSYADAEYQEWRRKAIPVLKKAVADINQF